MCKRWRRARLCGDLDKNLIIRYDMSGSFVRTSTAGRITGQPLAAIHLPFFSFPSFTPPRSENPQCSSVCQQPSAYVCLMSIFFFLFSCLSAVNKAPVLLYCSQRVRESVKAEALACRFQREIERVTFHT